MLNPSRYVYPMYIRYKLKKGEALSLLEEYKRSQWFSPAHLREIQFKRLRSLLEFCANHVTYYRDLFKKMRFDLNDVTSLGILQELPILRRETLQDRLDDFVPNNLDQGSAWKNYSGGSTGKPVIVIQDKNYILNNMAITMRHDQWAGWDFGVAMAKVWGADRDLAIGFKEKFKQRFIRQQIHLDSFEITEAKLHDFVGRIQRFRPKIIVGYASSLYQLARYISENQRRILGIRGIISSAEALFPEHRRLIEEAFHAKVFNRYGSREVGLVASECDQHVGLHVASETQIVEVVAKSNNGCGEVVVTNLCNYATPLIRYALEDVAISSDESCPCGRGLSLLKKIVGRTSDILHFTNGQRVHGEFFTHLFYGVPEVKSFRVVQEDLDKLRIELVIKRNTAEANIRRIRQRVEESCKHLNCAIEFRLVEALPSNTPTGKFRFTVSELKTVKH